MGDYNKILKEAEKIKKRNKKVSIESIGKEYEKKSGSIITKKDIYNFFGGKKNNEK
jgi:hypothetical protein